MPKPQEIDVSNHSLTTRIQSIIHKRQKGKCCECGVTLESSDKIISSGYKRRYYHSQCARKLNII